MRLTTRFIVLMLTMATLVVAIGLSTTMSARAADDAITQTLEDANRSLGGDFVLDPDESAMTRTRQGEYANGDPVEITDYLSITSEAPNTYCQSYPGEFWKPYSFHGRDGCKLTYGDDPANVIWEVPFATQSRGDVLVLDAGSIVDECYCFVQHPEEGQRVSYDSINALPMAEALNQAAIKNQLYEPTPGEVIPAKPQEVPAGQRGVPADQDAPTDADGLLGIPWPIVLGNLGIPVMGAMAGAAISGIVAAGGNGLALEAERWTASNLHPLVEVFPFEVRLEAFKADMQKIDDDTIRDKKYVINPWQGYDGADGLNTGVKKAARTVDEITDVVGTTFGMPPKKIPEGWTCHNYVTYAHQRVQEAAETHFPGATVTKRRLVEQSTLNVENENYGLLDYLDWKYADYGHALDKVVTRNGSTKVALGVDLWSHHVTNAPIVRLYDEAISAYKNAVGLSREFVDMEWVDKSPPPEPTGPEDLARARRAREEFLKEHEQGK